MKAFIKTLLAAAVVLCLSACQKPDSQVGILSFSVDKALNSVLGYDVKGIVDETSKNYHPHHSIHSHRCEPDSNIHHN